MRGGGDSCRTSAGRFTDEAGTATAAISAEKATCVSGFSDRAFSLLGKFAGVPGPSLTQQHEPEIGLACVQPRGAVWQQDGPQLVEGVFLAGASQQLFSCVCSPHSHAWQAHASTQLAAPNPCMASARTASQMTAVVRVRGRIMAIITTLAPAGKFSLYNPH